MDTSLFLIAIVLMHNLSTILHTIIMLFYLRLKMHKYNTCSKSLLIEMGANSHPLAYNLAIIIGQISVSSIIVTQ